MADLGDSIGEKSGLRFYQSLCIGQDFLGMGFSVSVRFCSPPGPGSIYFSNLSFRFLALVSYEAAILDSRVED